MKANSIISILLNDKNVNLYTKLLIFLYYRQKNNDFLISDNIICKYLKIDNNKNNRVKIYRTLKQIEKEKIIKLKIKLRRRYFKWNIKQDNEEKIKKLIDIPDFNWLESALN